MSSKANARKQAEAPSKTPSGAAAPSIIRPGSNAWGQFHADRLAVLIDGDCYFSALQAAMEQARRQILVIGWDFDSRMRLSRPARGEDADAESLAVGEFVRDLVRRKPDLSVHVLIWDSPLIYAFDREPLPAVKMAWLLHPRLHFRLDDCHPLSGSLHQKIVVIDDEVAFTGGMDITSGRWDTSGHIPDDDRRSDAGIDAYGPVHDVQAMVGGEAAAKLGDLARDRWRIATGSQLARPVLTQQEHETAWPSSVPPLIENVSVALSRTQPAWEDKPEVREIEALFLDMIAAAKKFIYFENQYFASVRIGEALLARLQEPDGPEIVVVTPKESAAWLERVVMEPSRAQLLHTLAEGDLHGRLRVYWTQAGTVPIKVHAKVMVVDDCMLRIGSANLNNRSMGMDTECDLMLEAQGDPCLEAAIGDVRRRLMAEHCGLESDEIDPAIAKAGGLIKALDAMEAKNHRQLVPFLWPPPGPRKAFLPMTDSFDPDRPLESELFDAPAPNANRRALMMRLGAFGLLLALVAGLAVLWSQVSPGEWRTAITDMDWLWQLKEHPLAPVGAILAFILGGIIAVPVTLMILVTAMLFGPWTGVLIALAGSISSAVVTYFLGHVFGRDTVRRLAGKRTSRITQALSRHGVLAVAVVRVVPVAPFTIINLVAGATSVRFRPFVAGTVVGMGPGIVAMSLLGDRLVAVMQHPDTINIVLLVAVAVATVLGGFLFTGRLLRNRAQAKKTKEESRV